MLRAVLAAWKRLGLLLARVSTPVFITVLFVFVFTPVGLVLRLLRRRPLRDGFVRGAVSYWFAVPARRWTLAGFTRPF